MISTREISCAVTFTHNLFLPWLKRIKNEVNYVGPVFMQPSQNPDTLNENKKIKTVGPELYFKKKSNMLYFNKTLFH